MKNSSDQSVQNHPSFYANQSSQDEFEASFHDQPHIPLLLRKSYARSKSSLSDELRHFRITLKWCALDHSTTLGRAISYLIFFLLVVIIPIFASLAIKIPSKDPLCYNKLVHIPESSLALIAFLTLCRFFKKYGLRQLLFLDALNDDPIDVQRGYRVELDRAFRYLAFIALPSFLVEFAHKVLFFSNIVIQIPFFDDEVGSLPLNSIMFVSGLASWVYRTGVFLLVCVLFRLTCELQLLRLESLKHMLQVVRSEPGDLYTDHRKIREQLCVTSHRFRFFIVGCAVIITVSQFSALLLVLATKSEKNFFNSGDLVVCSAVQLSGFLLCLVGAARITHRAQAIVSVATRWHMETIMTNRSNIIASNQKIKDELPPIDSPKTPDCNDQRDDLSCSSDAIATILQDTVDFQIRQTLVTYLEYNNGGITLFGYTLDRGMLHTLFAFEFSLVLWILSKGTTANTPVLNYIARNALMLQEIPKPSEVQHLLNQHWKDFFLFLEC